MMNGNLFYRVHVMYLTFEVQLQVKSYVPEPDWCNVYKFCRFRVGAWIYCRATPHDHVMPTRILTVLPSD